MAQPTNIVITGKKKDGDWEVATIIDGKLDGVSIGTIEDTVNNLFAGMKYPTHEGANVTISVAFGV